MGGWTVRQLSTEGKVRQGGTSNNSMPPPVGWHSITGIYSISKYISAGTYDFSKILLTHGLFQAAYRYRYAFTNHTKEVTKPEIGAAREVGLRYGRRCGVREEARHPLYG